METKNFFSTESDVTEKIMVYRAKWENLVSENPNSTVVNIRNKSNGVYMWLYRNDKSWLKRNIPLRNSPISRINRVNWSDLDKSISSKVFLAAEIIRSEQNRVMQVTVSSIGKEIGHLAVLQKHLKKLPLSEKALSECIETRENYAIRRIKWANAIYRNEEVVPNRWQLIKKAGIERLLGNPLILIALEIELNAYSL